LLSCVTGTKALIANDAIENELSTPAGEWMSDVFKPSFGDSLLAACLIFELELEEFAKRIKVELIYQDINNTILKATLFDFNVTDAEGFFRIKRTELLATFEFYIKHVWHYQVSKRSEMFIFYSSFITITGWLAPLGV